MRARALILILLMLGATPSLAQNGKATIRDPAPEQLKAFVDEIGTLYRKYPEAVSRYRLVDVGEKRRMDCRTECEFNREWGGWCKDVCKLEE